MAGTNELLDAICAELKARYTALKVCEPHDGRFDMAEVKRIATKAPAIYVACLRVPDTDNPGTGEIDADCQFVAYVLTRDSRDLKRGEAARNLVDDLLVHVPTTRWGFDGVGIAEKLKGDNLYSGSIDKHGIALWAVSWQQTNLLGESVWNEVGVMPTELYVGLEPLTGTDNVTEYDPVL